jgi:hypothetical protein
MDSHCHTYEIDKFPVAMIKQFNIDPERLNHVEQLGLYLIGQISRGKLCELWGSGFLEANEITNAVIKAIEGYIPEWKKVSE